MNPTGRWYAYYRAMIAMIHEDRRAAIALEIENGGPPRASILAITRRYYRRARY